MSEETNNEENLEETPNEQSNDNEADIQDDQQDVDTDGDQEDESADTGADADEQEEEVIDPDKYEIGVRQQPEDSEIDYGEDIDPEDAKTIGAVVEKQTAAVKQQLQDTQDRLEVDAYIKDNPQFDKYRPVILKHMKHPAYKQIPVKNIAAMVASNDLMKLGAKAEREAQAKADSSKTKGTTVRKPAGGQMDWDKAPAEAVEDQIRKVKGHRV